MLELFSVAQTLYRASAPCAAFLVEYSHSLVVRAHATLKTGREDLCVVQLYTSGSTGKPKGVEHTTGGYMVGAATTFKYVFDYRPDDIYWCTADCGWITGHSYVTYGELTHLQCIYSACALSDRSHPDTASLPPYFRPAIW